MFLNYATATSTGLVLYSTVEQFLLSTDADILSPTTAKVNVLSGYECDDKVEAVSIGTSQTFISKSPQYTRLFELTDINADSHLWSQRFPTLFLSLFLQLFHR